jgi:hypothetical protein
MLLVFRPREFAFLLSSRVKVAFQDLPKSLVETESQRAGVDLN